MEGSLFDVIFFYNKGIFLIVCPLYIPFYSVNFRGSCVLQRRLFLSDCPEGVRTRPHLFCEKFCSIKVHKNCYRKSAKWGITEGLCPFLLSLTFDFLTARFEASLLSTGSRS